MRNEIKELQEQPSWTLRMYSENYHCKCRRHLSPIVTNESCKPMYPRNKVWFRYIILNNLHKDNI